MREPWDEPAGSRMDHATPHEIHRHPRCNADQRCARARVIDDIGRRHRQLVALVREKIIHHTPFASRWLEMKPRLSTSVNRDLKLTPR